MGNTNTENYSIAVQSSDVYTRLYSEFELVQKEVSTSSQEVKLISLSEELPKIKIIVSSIEPKQTGKFGNKQEIESYLRALLPTA